MANGYTVSDLVAEFLDKCGAETAFGIVSVHNIPMLDAVSRSNRTHFVPTRGELGAAHMADGYARASGTLGVLISSTGPGAANTVGGLVEARTASAPILHITGQNPAALADRGMGLVHDIPDQPGLMAASGKAAYRIRAGSEAFAVMKRAVEDALTFQKGPVTVEIPIDVQLEEITRPSGLDVYALPKVEPVHPTGQEMDHLVDLVLEARRPMLWLGRGAAAAGNAARVLLDQGFGMVTSWAGHGVVSDDHPRNLGALNGLGVRVIEDFYQTVDLMIVAGSRLRGHETGNFSTPLPRKLVQIDIDPAADGRTYPNTGFIRGDAALVLAALAERIQDRIRIEDAFPEEVARLKSEARAAFRATLGPYGSFAEELRAAMPEDAIWARDVTLNNSTWGHKLMPLHDHSTNIYPMGAGIGQGLCMGIGAAMAPGGRKTVAMTGDGGFYMHLAELWTAVQENLDLTILVMNDGGYGVIRHIQDKAADGRRGFDVIEGPDLEIVADAARVPFWRVRSAAEFGETVRQAIATTGVALVEVDILSVGDFPPYFPYGPKA
ncbi:MAG: thiamine pyrophosphate-binding protein [Paracoccaceae bacterium]|nr:thiamine pyrophosphate-binding protein [Paracoccaceae bacterium]